jgi:hypothetical protein
LHRQWFDSTALSNLLGPDFLLGCRENVYRTLDKLLANKGALFSQHSNAGYVVHIVATLSHNREKPSVYFRSTDFKNAGDHQTSPSQRRNVNQIALGRDC